MTIVGIPIPRPTPIAILSLVLVPPPLVEAVFAVGDDGGVSFETPMVGVVVIVPDGLLAIDPDEFVFAVPSLGFGLVISAVEVC